MGICCSRPHSTATSTAASVASEHTRLLPNTQPYEPSRSHLSPEQLAQQREEDRLRHLEQATMDALIAQRQSVGDFPHHLEPFGQPNRDYTEVLRRFNQQIKLPMVSITSKNGGGGGVAGVLAGGRVEARWMEMVGWAGEQVMGVVEKEYMDVPKDELVVKL